MSSIYVKLLGTPFVLKNNEKVNFPFMKAEAIFYYLVINKHATREELVALFWSENSEKTGKKNLRNAMYKIRKAFNQDVIISPQKSVVMINQEVDLETDIDEFINNRDQRIDIYKGEFLNGFIVRSANSFEEWIFSKREYYKGLYITELYNTINKLISLKNYDKAENLGRALVNEDEFDERAYRTLMYIFKRQSNYNKSIELYNRLQEILEKELGIEPDADTKELYNEIVSLKNTSGLIKDYDFKDFFYGRKREINTIAENFTRFIHGEKAQSIAIIGEAGVGKTKLKDRFVDMTNNSNIYKLESNCYQVEEKYFLKPWNTVLLKLASIISDENIIMPSVWMKLISYLFPGFYVSDDNEISHPIEQIDTLKFHVIEEAILSVFTRVAQKKKILLLFDDLQWMDEMSMSLLTNVMLRNNNIMIIGTCRNSYDLKIQRFLTTMNSKNAITKIELERFTVTQVDDFIECYLPDIKIDQVTKNRIYKETEGNAFFLIEFLNMVKEKGSIDNFMPSKIQDILKSRFFDISDEGKKLLDIISMFFDEVLMDFMIEISGKEELDILDIIEELQNKYIVREVNGEKIGYQFTHQKLREYVYTQMPYGKQKILHKRIAHILIEALNNYKKNMSIYPKLIYHLSSAGNITDALKYSIYYLDNYLDFKHELFPILENSDVIEQNSLYLGQEQVLEYFNNIDMLFGKISLQEDNYSRILKLNISFLHMKGRYLIREGSYVEGMNLIKKMIDDSIKIDYYEYALKGYRQKIYYCIQVHKIDLMEEYINNAIEIAVVYEVKEEIAVLLRLKGLNMIMKEKYFEAEEILKKSIDIFKEIDNNMEKYSLNIAACYNYIGEIRRHNMKFSDALNYYDIAMKICKNKKILRGLNIFNTNAGQAAYEMGDYFRAKQYLKDALYANDKMDSIWGRSTAEGYLALLLSKEGKYNEALNHVKNADIYSKKLKSPYEEGIIYRVKAEIRNNMDNNIELKTIFSDYLDATTKYYCDIGIKLLKEVKESYEIEIIKAFIK